MLRILSVLVLFFASVTTSLAYTAPDDPVKCIQLRLNGTGAKLQIDGRLGAGTKMAAFAYARAKKWTLPSLDQDGTDVWCDALTADAVGLPELTAFPRPGELYFNIAEQQIMPLTGPQDACFLPLMRYHPSGHEPQLEGYIEGNAPGQNTPYGVDFGGAVMHETMLLLRTMPEGAFQGRIDTMKQQMLLWARANAPQEMSKNELDNLLWGPSEIFPNLLIARDALREKSLLTAVEAEVMQNWLSHFASVLRVGEELRLGSELQDASSRYRDHNTYRMLGSLLWGVETNDPALFNRAVRNGYVRFLRTIYSDGHILEAYRGRAAFVYYATGLGAALLIAEAASRQGLDLYSLSVNGHTIHDAVAFFAAANTKPSLMARYAKEDMFIGPENKFDGSFEDWWKYNDEDYPVTPVGWMDLYLKRFPTSPASADLKGLRADMVQRLGRSYFENIGFGNVTCFFPPDDQAVDDNEEEVATVAHIENDNFPGRSQEVDAWVIGDSFPKGEAPQHLDLQLHGNYRYNDTEKGSLQALFIDLNLGVDPITTSCGVRENKQDDGQIFPQLVFTKVGNAFRIADPQCVLQSLEPTAASEASFVMKHFRNIAVALTSPASAGTIKNDGLRSFLADVAEGTISVGGPELQTGSERAASSYSASSAPALR